MSDQGLSIFDDNEPDEVETSGADEDAINRFRGV